MPNNSGRHSRNAKTVPVREFLGLPAARNSARHRAGGSGVAVAAPLRFPTAAVALTAATAVAFAPIALHTPLPQHVLPSITVPSIHLDAAADQIQSLKDAVNTELASLDATIATIVGVPGQTLATVLTSAASLNSGFWKSLITASAASPLLSGALQALEAVSSGGLTQLAGTVTAANADLVLTTKQISSLLTSTITGSAATALLAFAGIATNPLSLSSYVSLLDVPFTIGGGVLSNVITAANDLGANAISLGGTIVTGVTGQIGNIVDAVNTLVNGVKSSIDNNIVDGVITAVQGVVAAPLQAILAGVNGVTNAITGGATSTLGVVATAAEHITHTWLGNGTSNGAIQNIINTIGSAPLSPEAWVAALNTATQAAIGTVTSTATTVVAGLAPIPFTVGAGLVNAAADSVTAFSNGVAEIAAGLLTAVGVPGLLTNTVYGVAGAFNTGIKVAAAALTASLNTVATLIGAATSITGLYSPAPAAAVPAPSAKSLVSLAATASQTATATAATAATKTSAAKAPTASTAAVAATGTAATAEATKTAAAASTAPSTTPATGTPATATSTKAAGTTSGKPAAPATAAKDTATDTSTKAGATAPAAGKETTASTAPGTTSSASGKHSKPDTDTAKTPTPAKTTASSEGGKHAAASSDTGTQTHTTHK